MCEAESWLMNFSAESLNFAQSSPGFMAKLEISIMDARFPNKSSLILFKLWEGGERTQVSVVGEIMTPKYSQVLCPQT